MARRKCGNALERNTAEGSDCAAQRCGGEDTTGGVGGCSSGRDGSSDSERDGGDSEAVAASETAIKESSIKSLRDFKRTADKTVLVCVSGKVSGSWASNMERNASVEISFLEKPSPFLQATATNHVLEIRGKGVVAPGQCSSSDFQNIIARGLRSAGG